MIELHHELLRLPRGDEWALETDRALRDTHEWAVAMLKRLEKRDPVSTVLSVNEDILGIYSFDPTSSDELW